MSLAGNDVISGVVTSLAVSDVSDAISRVVTSLAGSNVSDVIVEV